MASSFYWKLKALMRKNIILMKRNLMSTLFEIFFPISMFCLIIGLRQVFTRETEHFEDKEKTVKNYTNYYSVLSSLSYLKLDKIKNDSHLLKDFMVYADKKKLQEIKNLNQSEIDIVELIDMNNITNFTDFINGLDNETFSNLTYMGLNYETNPFFICSDKNEDKVARPIIAQIGEPLPSGIKNKMIVDSIIYNKASKLNFILNESSFHNF